MNKLTSLTIALLFGAGVMLASGARAETEVRNEACDLAARAALQWGITYANGISKDSAKALMVQSYSEPLWRFGNFLITRTYYDPELRENMRIDGALENVTDLDKMGILWNLALRGYYHKTYTDCLIEGWGYRYLGEAR